MCGFFDLSLGAINKVLTYQDKQNGGFFCSAKRAHTEEGLIDFNAMSLAGLSMALVFICYSSRPPEGNHHSEKLINKYSELPMDFADATIVCLAIDTGIKNIITFDQKDFNIYRLKNQPFVITP